MSKTTKVNISVVLKEELDGLLESLIDSRVAVGSVVNRTGGEYTRELLYDWQLENHPEISPAVLEALALFMVCSGDADKNRKDLHQRLTN